MVQMMYEAKGLGMACVTAMAFTVLYGMVAITIAVYIYQIRYEIKYRFELLIFRIKKIRRIYSDKIYYDPRWMDRDKFELMKKFDEKYEIQ